MFVCVVGRFVSLNWRSVGIQSVTFASYPFVPVVELLVLYGNSNIAKKLQNCAAFISSFKSALNA